MMMKARTELALVLVLALVVTAVPTAAQEPSHGGSMANTHNDLYVVQGDAQNPNGLDAGYGNVLVRETISFANDDPAKVPDYGIVYMTPEGDMQPTYPRVTAYTWDYKVANYTLELYNETTGYTGNWTGIVGDSFQLLPGNDLNPDEDGQPHPRVNATYLWTVKVVSTEDREIFFYEGGEVTTEIFNATAFDLSTLELPVLGDHHHEADADELIQLTLRLWLEDHPSLKDGFYRMWVSGMVFEYGMAITIEVRYLLTARDGRVVIEKLVFNARTIHVDVYHSRDMEVLMTMDVGGKGPKVSPTQSSSEGGEPTTFTTSDTFSLVIQEEGTDSTDWGLYGRYALLGALIAVLLFLVLWSGPRKRGREEDEDEEEEDEDPEVAQARRELEDRKTAILEQIKDLDRRHDDGEMGDGVWKRRRTSLKARAVGVIKQIEELEKEVRDEEDEEEED